MGEKSELREFMLMLRRLMLMLIRWIEDTYSTGTITKTIKR